MKMRPTVVKSIIFPGCVPLAFFGNSQTESFALGLYAGFTGDAQINLAGGIKFLDCGRNDSGLGPGKLLNLFLQNGHTCFPGRGKHDFSMRAVSVQHMLPVCLRIKDEPGGSHCALKLGELLVVAFLFLGDCREKRNFEIHTIFFCFDSQKRISLNTYFFL